jgi:hypothetical protein
MSLLDTASLVVTPNGTKAGKLYSVVPSSGAGDLDVTRATTATRVNSSGLIESVASNVPRLDYTNGSCPSILVEPQRTNIIVYSQDFSSNWFKSGITTTPNSGTSPLGTNTATKYTSTANGSYMFQAVLLQNAFTVSCFVKKVNADWIFIGSNISGVGDFGASFNINTGAVGTISGSGTTCSIEDYGNGWYRCIVTKDFAGAVPLCVVVPLSGDNNFSNQNGKEYLIWGYQGEVGSYATSYIPTTSASVTRNADVISKTGISSLIGQTEGTVFVDIDIDSSFAQADTRFINVTDGTATNWYFIGTNNPNEFRFYFRSSSTVYVTNVTTFTSGRHKLAFAYANNDYVAYIDGVQVNNTTTLAVGSTSKIELGNSFSSDIGKEYINSSALWKTRLNNTQLASLTTI